MGLKIGKEREMFSPGEKVFLKYLALGNKHFSIAFNKGISESTVKNQVSVLYNKIEKVVGTRPTRSNLVLFAIFGRFLSEGEVEYLVESGELFGWKKEDGSEGSS